MKKSKGTLTVEQMVRECFSLYGIYFIQPSNYPANEKGRRAFSRFVASRARRFVRLEERHKAEQSHLKFLDECRNKGIQQGVIKLPKHFGEMRFKAACRKTTGKGKA